MTLTPVFLLACTVDDPTAQIGQYDERAATCAEQPAESCTSLEGCEVAQVYDCDCACPDTAQPNDYVCERSSLLACGCLGECVPSGKSVCEQTAGTWDSTGCTFRCGEPDLCYDAFFESCICPIDSTFVPGFGCELDPSCTDADADECWADEIYAWVEPEICSQTNWIIDEPVCALLTYGDCPEGYRGATVYLDPCRGADCAALCPMTAGVCLDVRCESDADCPSATSCVPPEGPVACGMCEFGEPCTTDEECGGDGMICDDTPPPFGCPSCSDGPICMQGCTSDEQCLTGEVCNTEHRCTPAICMQDSDCPEHFVCGGGLALCTRKSCSQSSDCDGGSCVHGQCYSSPGECMPPVP